MLKKRNEQMIPVARDLRKNMTKEERHLWYDFLRDYDVKFTRQKILGRFIADFYCASAKLVIELDGSHHFDPETVEYDAARTEFLEQFGLEIIRIPNIDVNRNFRVVCEYIDRVVKARI